MFLDKEKVTFKLNKCSSFICLFEKKEKERALVSIRHNKMNI